MSDGWAESRAYVLGHIDTLRDQLARLTDAIEKIVLMSEHHKRALAHVTDAALEAKEVLARTSADTRDRLVTLEARQIATHALLERLALDHTDQRARLASIEAQIRVLQDDPGTQPGRPVKIPGNGHDPDDEG